MVATGKGDLGAIEVELGDVAGGFLGIEVRREMGFVRRRERWEKSWVLKMGCFGFGGCFGGLWFRGREATRFLVRVRWGCFWGCEERAVRGSRGGHWCLDGVDG